MYISFIGLHKRVYILFDYSVPLSEHYFSTFQQQQINKYTGALYENLIMLTTQF